MIALLDNTVLSNFAAVNRSDLIQLALGEVAATVEQVMEEHWRGVRLGRIPACNWSWLPILQLNESEFAVYHHLLERVNSGEAACLALAQSRDYRVFTDDRDAREIANQLRVPISGTLGILVRLVDQRHIVLADANAILVQMIASGYRAPVSDLASLL